MDFMHFFKKLVLLSACVAAMPSLPMQKAGSAFTPGSLTAELLNQTQPPSSRTRSRTRFGDGQSLPPVLRVEPPAQEVEQFSTFFSQEGNSTGWEELKKKIDALKEGDKFSFYTPTITNVTGSNSFVGRIKAARDRGVNVEANLSLDIKPNLALAAQLIDYGALVHLRAGEHRKVYTFIRDGNFETLTGSANATNNSLFHSKEFLCNLPQELAKQVDETNRRMDAQLLQKLTVEDKQRITATPNKPTAYASSDTKLLNLIVDSADRAKPGSTLKAATMTISSPLIRTLMHKQEQGCTAELIVDRQGVNASNQGLLQKAHDAGVKVRVVQGRTQHEKLFVKQEPAGDDHSPKRSVAFSTGNLTYNSDNQPNISVYCPNDKKLFNECDAHLSELAQQSTSIDQVKVRVKRKLDYSDETIQDSEDKKNRV